MKKKEQRNERGQMVCSKEYTQDESIQIEDMTMGEEEINEQEEEVNAQHNKTTQNPENRDEMEDSGGEGSYMQVEEEDYGLTSNDESTVVNDSQTKVDFEKIVTGEEVFPKKSTRKSIEKKNDRHYKTSYKGKTSELVSFTQEDDENTVLSGETNNMGRKES